MFDRYHSSIMPTIYQTGGFHPLINDGDVVIVDSSITAKENDIAYTLDLRPLRFIIKVN